MINVADQALNLLKKSSDPYFDIKRSSCYWIPLQWLYVEMVKKKGIEPIGEIGKSEKSRYWKLTEGENWKRICQVQAMYCHDQLKTT